VHYDQKVESISGFGQAEYEFNAQWKLIGGLRYERETRHLNGFGSAFGGAQALPPTSVSPKMTPLTGKIELDYKPVEGALIYASASRGAKSGGFTTYNTGNSSAIQPFKAEILRAYEVGFKTNIIPSLQVNGSVFFYDYKNQQVLSTVFTANGLVGRFANVPKSEIWGGELELVFRPNSAFIVTQNSGNKMASTRNSSRSTPAPRARQAGRSPSTARARRSPSPRGPTRARRPTPGTWALTTSRPT
jgi:outer membrane receptor protein involved in Fe transport